MVAVIDPAIPLDSGFAIPALASRGAERAAAIVASAYDLLGVEGLEGLTVRAVLKAAGISRRSFYDHFLGKDDLVLAVFSRSICLAADSCRKRVAEVEDPLEQLRIVVLQIAMGDPSIENNPSQSIRRGAALCREHMRLAEARPGDLAGALEPLLRLFAEILEYGMKNGQIRDYAPDRLAVLVYNLLSTTVHAELLIEEASGVKPQRRQRLAHEIWDFCYGAVAQRTL